MRLQIVRRFLSDDSYFHRVVFLRLFVYLPYFLRRRLSACGCQQAATGRGRGRGGGV